MPVCPRCGVHLKRINKKHKQACVIPLPEVLTKEWEQDTIATTKTLARKYDVHSDFMRSRLEQGGVPAYLQALRGHRVRRMNWGQVEKELPNIPEGHRLCSICDLIITKGDEYCGFCIAAAKKEVEKSWQSIHISQLEYMPGQEATSPEQDSQTAIG